MLAFALLACAFNPLQVEAKTYTFNVSNLKADNGKYENGSLYI